MSGDKAGFVFQFDSEIFFQYANDGHGIGHKGRLGIGGERQLVFRPFNHQFEQILRNSVVDFLKYVPCRLKIIGKFFPHADKLWTLAGEYKGIFHLKNLYLLFICTVQV